MSGPLHKRTDRRGSLIEVSKEGYAQCNILRMKKGTIWGGHYHKITSELFYVIAGEIELECISLVNAQKSKKMYRQDESFAIMPHTLHRIYVKKDTILVVLYSHVFDEQNPDLYT